MESIRRYLRTTTVGGHAHLFSISSIWILSKLDPLTRASSSSYQWTTLTIIELLERDIMTDEFKIPKDQLAGAIKFLGSYLKMIGCLKAEHKQ